MKRITQLSWPARLLFFAMAILLWSCSATQPVTATRDEIIAAIQQNRWIFIAERSDPPVNRGMTLSSGYFAECRGDTAVFELPYAGVMQGPARFPDGTGPLKFTSTKVQLVKEQKADGRWIVQLKPLDQPDVVSATFTFFDNGRASLDVMLANRSPIDFFGKVTPLR
jgi:hypothetical protein